jgi:hypothetical protein
VGVSCKGGWWGRGRRRGENEVSMMGQGKVYSKSLYFFCLNYFVTTFLN